MGCVPIYFWEKLMLSEETEKNSIRSSSVYVGSMQGQ